MTALEQAIEWHRSGQTTKAESAYRELLLADSDNADAHNLLGMLLLGSDRSSEAETHFKEATNKYPNNVSYLLNYASVFPDRESAEA